MVSFAASTRQPPAGGPKATVDDGDLLRRLRLGDRDAFVHYCRRFRAPVHHFAWRLLRDERSAVTATTETLVGVFRRAILDDGAGDLTVLTYSGAFAACEARTGSHAREGGPRPRPAGASEPRRRKHAAAEAVRLRFDAALESLELRPRAALLLHDLAGLDAVRSGAVLGLEEEAAAALLFKAREEFRAALRERDGRGPAEGCRQAEDAVAAAVGLGMGEDERSRLRSHAGYCRPCRKVMRDWTWTGAGLAAVLMPPPLPQALAATPVFGEILVRPATAPAHRRVLAAAGRTLRARTTAWVLAVACLAVAAGVTVHGLGVRPLVLAESVGPAIRLIGALPSGEEPAAARSGAQSTAAPAGAIGISAATSSSRSAATQSAGTARPPRAEPGSDASTGGQPGDGSQTGEDGAGGGQPGQDAVGGGAEAGDGTSEKDAIAAAREEWAARAAARAAAQSDWARGHTWAGRANARATANRAHTHAKTSRAHTHATAGRADGRAQAGRTDGRAQAGRAHGRAKGERTHERDGRSASRWGGKASGSDRHAQGRHDSGSDHRAQGRHDSVKEHRHGWGHGSSGERQRASSGGRQRTSPGFRSGSSHSSSGHHSSHGSTRGG